MNDMSRLAEIEEQVEQALAWMREGQANWTRIAREEREKSEVAFMCDEGPMPAHPITTARAMAFESCADRLARALRFDSGEEA